MVIHAEEELLTQMFTNLLKIPIHYAPGDNAHPSSLAKDSDGILASVCDDGPGISADQTVLRSL